MGKATEKLEWSQPNGRAQSDISDEDLFAKFRQQDDKDAFAALVHRYERELYSYLRRYLGDANMAEDTFQATFLQVHLKRDQFEAGRRFRPWLYTIATNQAIDSQRRNRRHRGISLDRTSKTDENDDLGALVDLLVSKEPNPEQRLESEQRRQWIQGALEQLPPALREVVNLVYYQGLKYREAADVLSIPVGTVKSRLHAALLKLNEAGTAGNSPAENDE